jgi:hypothetical protein
VLREWFSGMTSRLRALRADLLDGRLCRLHGQRKHLLRQVVPATGEEVGVDRRQLEAGVADVDRAVEGRRVLHPFQPEPAFDRWRGIQDALFEFVDRAGQGGDEMGDHAGGLLMRFLQKGGLQL